LNARVAALAKSAVRSEARDGPDSGKGEPRMTKDAENAVLEALAQERTDLAIRTFTENRHTFSGDQIARLSRLLEKNYQGPIAIVGKLGASTWAFEAAAPWGLLGYRVSGLTRPRACLLRSILDLILHGLSRHIPGRFTFLGYPYVGLNSAEKKVVIPVARGIGELVNRYGAHRVVHTCFTVPESFHPNGELLEDVTNIPEIKEGFHFQRTFHAILARKHPRHPALGPIFVIVQHDTTGAALGELSEFGTLGPEARDRVFLYVVVGTGTGMRFMVRGKPFDGGERVNYSQNEAPLSMVFNGNERAPDYDYVALETRGFRPDFNSQFLSDGTRNSYYGKESLEGRTSGSALAACARRLVREGNPWGLEGAEDLERRAARDLSKLDAKILGQAANEGKTLAEKIIQTRAKELGIGIAVDIVMVQRIWGIPYPDHIVIGSGVSQIGEVFLEGVRAGLAERLAAFGLWKDETASILKGLTISQVKDDTGREFYSGRPTQEQVAGHARKLQSIGRSTPL
jgi:hypothetical protein